MLKVARPSSLSAKLSNPQLNLTLVGVMVMMKIRDDHILIKHYFLSQTIEN